MSDCGGKTELTCDDIENIFIPTWFNDDLSYGCWRHNPFNSAGKVEFEFGRMGNMILSGEGTCERQSGWVTGGWYGGERSTRIMLKERNPKIFSNLDTRTLCENEKEDFVFDKRACKMKQRR